MLSIPFRALPSSDSPLVPRPYSQKCPRPAPRDHYYPPEDYEACDGKGCSFDVAHSEECTCTCWVDETSRATVPFCCICESTRHCPEQNCSNRCHTESQSQEWPVFQYIPCTTRPSTLSKGNTTENSIKLGINRRIFEPVVTSDYPPPYSYHPPPYSEYTQRRESRKGKEREDDDEWQERQSSGDGRGGDEDDDEDGDEGREPPKKVPKKTPIACHFCRRRKLKCDGVRPSCANCLRRKLVCTYDQDIRRRGKGKKKEGQKRDEEQVMDRMQQGTSTQPPSWNFPPLIPPPQPVYPPPRMNPTQLGTGPVASGSGYGHHTQLPHQVTQPLHERQGRLYYHSSESSLQKRYTLGRADYPLAEGSSAHGVRSEDDEDTSGSPSEGPPPSPYERSEPPGRRPRRDHG